MISMSPGYIPLGFCGEEHALRTSIPLFSWLGLIGPPPMDEKECVSGMSSHVESMARAHLDDLGDPKEGSRSDPDDPQVWSTILINYWSNPANVYRTGPPQPSTPPI